LRWDAGAAAGGSGTDEQGEVDVNDFPERVSELRQAGKGLGENVMTVQLSEVVVPGVAAHEATTDLRVTLPEGGESPGTVQDRHHYVEQDQGDGLPVLAVECDGLGTAGRLKHVKAVVR